MWILLFFIFSFTLFAVPLIPALREILWPTDIDPLNIEYDHDRSITRFAYKFSQLSRAHLEGISSPKNISRETLSQVEETTGILIVAADGSSHLSNKEMEQRRTERRLIAGKDLILPEKFHFTREVYAGGNIKSGAANHFRALFAEEDVSLGACNEVLRWIHATNLYIGHDAVLLGRASADKEIHFLGSAHFERLNAPRICFGNVSHISDGTSAFVKRTSAIDQIAHLVDQRPEEGRIIAFGDLELPANSVLHSDLVVRGKLRIGAGAMVIGSIKAYRSIQMETGVTVHGAVVSAGRIVCGIQSVIDGPIISEQNVFIGPQSRVGSPTTPTTVSAPVIKVYVHDTIAYGTLWARVRGTVNSRAKI